MIDLLKGIQEEKRDIKTLAKKDTDKLIRMLELIKKEASEITEKVKMLEEQSKRTLEFVNQIKGTNTYKYIKIIKFIKKVDIMSIDMMSAFYIYIFIY